MGAAVVGPPPGRALEAQEAPPEAPTALTAEEYETLNAICSRLIPADENGPGAGEAMAARYIDRGLAGALEDAVTMLGTSIAQRVAGKATSRWLPVVGAAAVGAYAYWDTLQVARTARNLLEKPGGDVTFAAAPMTART